MIGENLGFLEFWPFGQEGASKTGHFLPDAFCLSGFKTDPRKILPESFCNQASP